MSVYIALLIIPFIIHICFSKHRKLEIFLISSVFILFVGLRASTVGHDTLRYVRHYLELSQLSIGEAIAAAKVHESPLYVLFAWFCSCFNLPVNAYFCVVAAAQYIPLGFLMYRYAKDIPNAYYLYTCLFLTLQLTGIKNCLATGALMLCYYYAVEKKPGKFVVSLIVAGLFHRTTFIFAIAYPLLNWKRKKTIINDTKLNFAIYALCLAVVFGLRIPLSNFLKRVGGYEDYGIYTATPWTMFVLCFGFVFLGYLCSNLVKQRNLDYHYVHNALLKITILASIFMPLVFVNPSALRVVKYFLLAAIFLVPNAFLYLARDGKNFLMVRLIHIGGFVLVGAEFLSTVHDSTIYLYKFFWQ